MPGFENAADSPGITRTKAAWRGRLRKGFGKGKLDGVGVKGGQGIGEDLRRQPSVIMRPEAYLDHEK
jgi:hypothetical protein